MWEGLSAIANALWQRSRIRRLFQGDHRTAGWIPPESCGALRRADRSPLAHHSHVEHEKLRVARGCRVDRRAAFGAESLRALGAAFGVVMFEAGFIASSRALDALNCLSKHLAIVSYPSGGMHALRIAVSPVDDAPFGVPGVLTLEGNDVSLVQWRNTAGQIDVVRNQYGLT